ncbi:MAG: hydantoinase/oxoprolinase family protein, partial [Deltaproteobacteria bacterium]|nr:hydantoinase/oxoprolinase family protein [Deltaproteobacteria bacterium]
NAILEGKGVGAGLLITQGFRAVYEARGWARPATADLIDTFYQKPPLLVPQRLTEGIEERVNFAGEVLTPLNEDNVRQAVRRLRGQGVEAVAVCYLFSFVNAAHEERTAQIIREEVPGWRISLSSRVLPVIREYPRLSTTVLDAYVGPIIERYLLRLAERLSEHGVTSPQIYLMQSNGGLMRITVAARFPNQTLLSGPAAGVVSGIELARLTGASHVVTFDMGGTSTDISVITEGRAQETSEGRIAGQDLGTPMLEVRTLGAGGGTVAWIGKDGLLKVGPRSAGAEPGPACYGRGGQEPTVTDANLLLGALSPESFLGGKMPVDPALAREAVRSRIAGPLGLDVIEAAAGIIRIVNTHMEISLRLALHERGQDPRRFALIAFGGAGPLHAAQLARTLQIPRVLVPLHPGITSAMGLLQTQVRHFYLQSSVGLLSQFPLDRMNGLFDQLETRALEEAREEGFPAAVVQITRQVDLRYLHQGYQLTVDCPAQKLTEESKAELKRAFDRLHHRLYGQSAAEEDAEVVTLRVVAEIPVPQLALPELPPGDGSAEWALQGERPLYDLGPGRFLTARVYDRARLRPGDVLGGPAVIEQFDSTTVVLSGQEARMDRFGNLVIDVGSAG